MIDLLIRTTLLLVLVTITTFALRRRSAALRHLLWSFAIVGTVAIPALNKLTPQWNVLPSFGDRGSVAEIGTLGATSERPSQPVTPAAGQPSPINDQPSAISNQPSARSVDWLSVIALFWLVGAVILLARLIRGLVVVHRIAARAREVTDSNWRMVSDRAAAALDVRWPVDVKVSSEVAMPFACGLFRPSIVIPASADQWSPQQRDAVMLHEFAHIVRGDLAMNMLSHVVRSLYWINPLAWLAAHKLRVEGERAADDAVLRGGAKASDYADHLLRIVREVGGGNVPKVALAMARRSDFEGRLLAILEPGVSRARLTRYRAAGLAVLFLAAVMPLAAMAPATGSRPTLESRSETVSSQDEVAAPKQSPAAPLPPVSATIAALGEALGDASPQVRMAAVNSLGALQDPAAIAALSRALKEDIDARVREAAAWALGEIDDNRAVPALLDALRTEKVAKVKEKIVHALGEIDDVTAVPGVSAVLRDPAVEVRRAAVQALHEFEDQAATSALISMIRDDDTEVRRRVANALGDLENPSAIDPLISMARDSDAEVRANAIESLHNFQDSRLLAIYTIALRDSSAHVREHAVDAFSNLELKTAPRALIDILSDSNRDVRRQAASVLGDIGDEAAVPALKKLVAESDPETRRSAVEALKEIGGQDAITVLMGLLRDPDPEVRKTAAEALGRKRGE